jgi:UDP-N-acetylmuramate dehydrogenase
MEFVAGIPGTIGGAVRMDAGTRDEWLGGIVRDLVCLDSAQGLVRHAASDIVWGYRSCSLPASQVVLEVSLDLVRGDRDAIAEDMQARLAHRRLRQPLGTPSCGSVFRNPEGASAGRLIADCGLAGLRIGGAQISEKHANFILNAGGAKAADVCALMGRMHDAVLAASGYDLVPEVRLLGFEG